jgi:hypothetical protein
MDTDPIADDDPQVQEYRRKAGELNGTAPRKSGADPRPGPPWSPPRREPAPLFDDSPTVRMDQLVPAVQAMIAADNARDAAQARRTARTWAVAGVVVVLLLCALVAWLGWLWLAHRGQA